MSDINQLQSQLRSAQTQAASAQARVSGLNAQLAGATDRLRELERELDGLEGFRHRVLDDGDTLRSQLGERGRKIQEIGAVRNVRSAKLMADRLSQAFDVTLARGVENNLSSVYQKTMRAIQEVEREISEQRARISSLNSQITAGHQQIAAAQRSIARTNNAIAVAQREAKKGGS